MTSNNIYAVPTTHCDLGPAYVNHLGQAIRCHHSVVLPVFVDPQRLASRTRSKARRLIRVATFRYGSSSVFGSSNKIHFSGSMPAKTLLNRASELLAAVTLRIQIRSICFGNCFSI